MEVTLAELPAYAERFVRNLPKERGKKAFVVGLSGELGAGKTAFVQEVARALGISRPVASPTYTIVQTYPVEHPVFTRLVHVDAYRLQSGEAGTIGWEEYVSNPENLVLVEWPERIFGGVPEGARHFAFAVTGEEVRSIEEKPV